MTFFNDISISGRYIYGYLCYINLVTKKDGLKVNKKVDTILKEFTSSNRLDLWHQKAEELDPSVVLDEENNEDYFEYIPFKDILEIRYFYSKHSKEALKALEYLFWIGISNLYVKFDSSTSLRYLNEVLKQFKDFEYLLPDKKVVELCSIEERGGWGNLVELDSFLR